MNENQEGEVVHKMIRDTKYPLLVKPDNDSNVYQSVTPEGAGWRHLHFSARLMREGTEWTQHTGEYEYALVLLGGTCTIKSSAGTWKHIGKRRNVFSGMPWAVYLPGNTEFTVIAESEELDIAAGWCKSSADHAAKLVTPEDVEIEIRGGGNATRQINGIIPPGFANERLVVVEVYTPAGNWSSYPPHKHDVHREEKDGQVIEADLEEIYFYKVDKPQGYAIQHVYNDDRSLDELTPARNNDIVLVPEGYHPVAAAPGYNVYYLNFLAGSAQSLASFDDPQHKWLKEKWPERDPRVPVVTKEM